jgi:tight adherence protein B
MLPFAMMGGGAFLVLLLIVFAFAGPNEAKAGNKRLSAIKDRHANSTGAVVEAQMRRIQQTRATRMDGIATKYLPNRATLAKRLDMTGKNWSPGKYLTVSLGILVVVAVLLKIQGLPILFSVVGGLFFGLFIPHFLVGQVIKRRVNSFTKRLPDAMELLVRGLRSGLPISETMNVVGAEIPGPIGEEFRMVGDKVRIGRTMDAALQETADRIGTPEFQFFCISLQIQRETGGNLAETLSNLANVLRMRSQMKLKIKAMSSESKASAYIIGSLPFIVFGLIWTINDHYMQSFFTDQRLIMTGLGGMVWMSLGALIMAKMISFEI